ncbi:MAG: nucleotidyltransferase [Sedimentisphaerales bacterium]|nr:nucleotidyltransferase [Sedimentisphaerales bacterium]
MTVDEYLQKLVNKYRVPAVAQGTPEFKAANSIYPIIQRWAGNQLREVTFSGSNAKGTAIRGRTDVDLFISLKSDTNETLKEIFNSLYNYMVQNGYSSTKKQHVSIHIVHSGIEVDLVPAKHFGGNTEDHWLYVNRPNRERIKTNVNEHINLVRDSNRTNEIILTKIWRLNHNLDFPSFYLELVVIEALKYKRVGLSENFLSVLEYLSNSFISARFIDPANTNNIISDDLADIEKKAIASQAKKSKAERLWESIVW